jgi:hypothetical protein
LMAKELPWWSHGRPPCRLAASLLDTVARRQSLLGATILRASEVYEPLIGLELRAKRIYAVLAQTFAKNKSAQQFFEVLSQHEQDHAGLLNACWEEVQHGTWNAEPAGPWRDLILRLEHNVQAIESSLSETSSLDDALWLVLKIESTEINDVFFTLASATPGNQIRDLRPFQEAMNLHIAHMCQHIPKLAPHLTMACQQLRAKFDRK